MTDRSDWYEEQRFREERAADLFERDIHREPREPFVRMRRTRGGDEVLNRLTETIAQPETDEERLDETTEVTP